MWCEIVSVVRVSVTSVISWRSVEKTNLLCVCVCVCVGDEIMCDHVTSVGGRIGEI